MKGHVSVRQKAGLRGCAAIPAREKGAAMIVSNLDNRMPDAALKIINALTNASAKMCVTACLMITNLTHLTSMYRYQVARSRYLVR